MHKTDRSTIASLAKDARLGDPDAFAALYAATISEEYRYCFCYLGDEYDTQDALCASYVRAMNSFHTLRRPQDFVPWLQQITYAECYRRLKNRASALHPELDEIALDPIFNKMLEDGRTALRKNKRRGKKRFPDADRKKKYMGITEENAALLLERIFLLADEQPNTIPLSVLIRSQQVQKVRFTPQRVLIGIFLAGLLILPCFFLTAGFDTEIRYADSAAEDDGTSADSTGPTEEVSGAENWRPYCVVSSDRSFPPVKSLTASIDGNPQKVYRNDDGTWTIVPDQNGKMTITETLWNFQWQTETVTIDTLDSKPPEVVSHSTSGGKVTIRLKDDLSGIDYSTLYAITESGDKIKPVSNYRSTGDVVFNTPDSSLEIHVSDRAGNSLEITIRVK